jgi:hypothetical protein
MNNFFRTIIAGYGAKKLGGGCFSTILIFILIYWALGKCNSGNRNAGNGHSSIIKEQKNISSNVKQEKSNASLYSFTANK